jgi:hypothetical protein
MRYIEPAKSARPEQVRSRPPQETSGYSLISVLPAASDGVLFTMPGGCRALINAVHPHQQAE